MQQVVGCCFRAHVFWVDRLFLATDDIAVKGIFDVGRYICTPAKSGRVRFIFSKERFLRLFTVQPACAELFIQTASLDHLTTSNSGGLYRERGPGGARKPGPGVAEPESRQKMERFPCWTSVGRADLDQNILRGVLGVLDKHVEIGIVDKAARVQQFILKAARICFPATIFVDQIGIRELTLWI